MPAGVSPVAPTPLVVLKFGSSVLDGAEGFRGAAREVARELAAGRRVVAVVSAAPGATDALLQAVVALDGSGHVHDVARLLATAEATSVAMLQLALRSEGVRASVAPEPATWLRTVGPPLDADPVEVDRSGLLAGLEARPVLALPGFVGCDDKWRPTLLGRGGSDLTALFLAWALGADECRLVKDVDGVYPADPNGTGGPRWPYRFVSWDRLSDVAGVLVQPKAVRLARDRGIRFRVAALGGVGTWVGAPEEALVSRST